MSDVAGKIYIPVLALSVDKIQKLSAMRTDLMTLLLSLEFLPSSNFPPPYSRISLAISWSCTVDAVQYLPYSRPL
jgi:hypothetical protein